jgi:hypothetical protein
MTRSGGAALVVGGLIVMAAAAPASLDTLDVGRENGIYTLYAATRLHASPEAIAEVLLDYDRFGRISKVYKDYGYLDPAPDGTPIVYTRMEGCLLFYCKSMTRVERLEIAMPSHIRTVTLPERSDFKRSISDWFIERDGSVTRVIYTLEMEPNFWIPPVIGPLYLKRTLRRGGGDALDRIEELAQAVDASEQGD